jgi:hypothetical protein
MLQLNDEELVAHLFRLIDEMNDRNSWEDSNHYAALTVEFQNARAEVLRRMKSG